MLNRLGLVISLKRYHSDIYFLEGQMKGTIPWPYKGGGVNQGNCRLI